MGAFKINGELIYEAYNASHASGPLSGIGEIASRNDTRFKNNVFQETSESGKLSLPYLGNRKFLAAAPEWLSEDITKGKLKLNGVPQSLARRGTRPPAPAPDTYAMLKTLSGQGSQLSKTFTLSYNTSTKVLSISGSETSTLTDVNPVLYIGLQGAGGGSGRGGVRLLGGGAGGGGGGAGGFVGLLIDLRVRPNLWVKIGGESGGNSDEADSELRLNNSSGTLIARANRGGNGASASSNNYASGGAGGEATYYNITGTKYIIGTIGGNGGGSNKYGVTVGPVNYNTPDTAKQTTGHDGGYAPGSGSGGGGGAPSNWNLTKGEGGRGCGYANSTVTAIGTLGSGGGGGGGANTGNARYGGQGAGGACWLYYYGPSIRINFNYGIGDGVPLSYNVYRGIDAGRDLLDPREIYSQKKFLGWSLDSWTEPNQTILPADWKAPRDTSQITLYAVWED